MAIIDQERGVIVVRIVYDGPPLSGKTTSVQALNQILGKTSDLFSPGENAGRTHYFDWMEYTGGYFRGYQISCQIISVPGQLSFQERRHFLLNSADVIVFVMDSSQEESHIALSYFKDLQPWLSRSDEAIRVIIQANKQDKERVLTAEQVKQTFAEYPEVKIVESTATLGKGVREAFVLAVRLAIERATALSNRGQLLIGKPDISSGEELLTLLQQQSAEDVGKRLEQLDQLVTEEVVIDTPEISNEKPLDPDLAQLFENGHPCLTEPELPTPVTAEPKKSRRSAKKLPRLPDEAISIHWIWPPMKGRELLKALFACQTLRPHLQADDTWLIEVPGEWRCFSKKSWCYPDSEQARQALRSQISQHLQCSSLLPSARCLAVAAEADEWRLWQILSRGPTLLVELKQILQTGSLEEVIKQLHQSAINLSHLHEKTLASGQCPFMAEWTLDSFGLNEQHALIYLGRIDEPTAERTSWSNLLEEMYGDFIQEIRAAFEPEMIITELEKYKSEPTLIGESLMTLLQKSLVEIKHP